MRPTWDEYFMNLLDVIQTRSTCLRRQVAAVIVKDKQIISTGYNGSPRGIKHCDEVGCLREKMDIPSGERHELCRGTHAEQNAIIQASLHGVSIEGADIYITCSPCVLCTKMLINSGIKRIVYKGEYPDKLALEMLNESGVELVKLED